MAKTEKRTVAVAGFPYRKRVVDAEGRERVVHAFAVRGDTIELFDEGDIARGDNNGHFVKPGEKAATPPSPFDLDDLGMLTDEQLFDMFADDPPATRKVLAAVGDDPTLARRALTAEQSVGRAPRKSLVEALEKLVEDEA